MKLGNGSHRRTPIWVWLVLLVCGTIVLPGAAMVIAQDNHANTALKETVPVGQPVAESLDQTPDSNLKANPYVGQVLPRAYYLGEESGIQYFPGNEGAKLQRKPVALGRSKTHASEAQSQILPVRPITDSNAEENDQWVLKSFAVGPVLDTIRRANLKNLSPERRLILEFPCRYPGENGVSTPQRRDVQFSTATGVIRLGGQSPTMKVIDDRLYVYDTVSVMQKVEETLALLNEHLFKQIVVECRIITTPREDLKKFGIDWSIGHSAVGQLTNPPVSGDNYSFGQNAVILDGTNQQTEVRAASFVEKSSPVIYSLIKSDDVLATIKQINAGTGSTIRQAPTVTMFSGQDAEISDGAMRPFVVGLDRIKDPNGKLTDAMQPVIRLVSDGTSVNLNADSKADGSVDLDCHVNFSQILSVDTAEIPIKLKKGGSPSIQIPEVATSQMHSSMNIPAGETLVLASFLEGEKGEKKSLLVMLTCRTMVDVRELPLTMSFPEYVTPDQVEKIIGVPGTRPVVRFLDEGGISQTYPEPVSRIPQLSKQADTATQPLVSDRTAEKAEPQASDHFTLRSSEPSNGKTDYQPLIDLFEKRHERLTIEGQVDYELSGEGVAIRGKNLVFELDSSPNESTEAFRISGKSGLIELGLEITDELFSVQFEGDVSFQLGSQQIVADKIKYAASDRSFELELDGNGKITHDMFEGSADRIMFGSADSPAIVLVGNARLVRNNPKSDIQAARIEWNCESDEIKSFELIPSGK